MLFGLTKVAAAGVLIPLPATHQSSLSVDGSCPHVSMAQFHHDPTHLPLLRTSSASSETARKKLTENSVESEDVAEHVLANLILFF